jgi:hypothetical protein
MGRRCDIQEQRAGAPDDGIEFDFVEVAFTSPVRQALPVRSETPDSEELVEAGSHLRNAIATWFAGLQPEERERLGFLPKAELRTPHFHSNRRVTSYGALRFGLVVQIVQMQTADIGGVVREFPCGMTLVIDVSGRVRFVIGAATVDNQRAEMVAMTEAAMTTALGWTIADPLNDPFAVDYRGMHEARI